jgi:putative ATP-dependent endonuclease of the OLD family
MINNISPELKNKYISIIEVGGAYAHKFRELLEFINVPTLIITDIDSININTHRSACEVDINENIETSNQTIIKFTEKRKIKDLLELKNENKVFKNIRLAFQIKENADSSCGRSFEEAFILKNSNLLSDNDNLNASKDFFEGKEDNRLVEDSFNETLNLLKKVSKSDFAFDIMLIDGWNTPKYIQEGLEWLKQQKE